MVVDVVEHFEQETRDRRDPAKVWSVRSARRGSDAKCEVRSAKCEGLTGDAVAARHLAPGMGMDLIEGSEEERVRVCNESAGQYAT
jgi:hypothetical protein